MQRFFKHNKNIIIFLLAFFLLLAAATETLQAQKLPELIPYRKGDKWGFADSTGKIIIEPKYDNLSFFRYGIGLVGLNSGHSYIIDKEGKILYSVYGGLSFANDSLIKFLDYHNTEPKYKYRKYHKYGYKNLQGKTIVPAKYDHISDFKDGMAMVRLNGLYGFVDKNGKEIVKPKYIDAQDFREGYAVVTKRNLSRRYVNKNGKIVSPDDLYIAYPFINGKACAEDVKGNYIVYDKNFNKLELCPQGVECPCWTPGYHNYRKDEKVGLVDSSGRIIVSPIYDAIYSVKDGYARVVKGRFSGYINMTGKVIVPIKYTQVRNMNEGHCVVYDTARLGLVDSSGNIIFLTDKYNRINDIVKEGLLKVCIKNGLCGYVNTRGETIVPFEFEEVGYFKNGVSIITKNNKRGVIDKTGNIIVPPIYESIKGFGDNGLAEVELNKKTYFIDKYGRVYFEE